jgi:hypothetical protein
MTDLQRMRCNRITTHNSLIFHVHTILGGSAMKNVRRYRWVVLNLILIVTFYVLATGFGSCYGSSPG